MAYIRICPILRLLFLFSVCPLLSDFCEPNNCEIERVTQMDEKKISDSIMFTFKYKLLNTSRGIII